MSWNYNYTPSPIIHRSGTVPERDLLPGDHLIGKDGVCHVVHGVAPTLLQLDSGAIRHRGPVQGDFSRVVTAMEAL